MRLILVTVAWVLGISLARALPELGMLHWVAAFVTCSLLLAVAGLRQKPGKLLLVLVMIAAGGTRQSMLPRTSDIAAYNGFSGTITGVVVDEPRYREDRIQLRLEAETVFVNSETVATSGLVLVDSQSRNGNRIRRPSAG